MATAKLTPYLMFKEGKAAEALAFYQGIMGGKVEIMKFGEMPGHTEHNKDMVMHGSLENGDLTLFASDGMKDEDVKPGNINVALNGDDEEKLTAYYEKLCEGGTVVEQLRKAPWGDSFGMVIDKYQIFWMVNIAGEGNEPATDNNDSEEDSNG